MTTKSQPSVRRCVKGSSSSSAAPPRLAFLCAAAAVAAATLGSSTAHAFCLTSGHASIALRTTSAVSAETEYRRQAEACTINTTSWRKRPRAQAVSSSSIDMRLGVTSTVIETVVKGVLNLALANPRQATVKCRINSSARELVHGHLEQAKVDGINWKTPMGMTMRTIALTLNGMRIMPAAVFRGKIKFKCPAEGQAVLDLDARDFGNFLVHPLMGKADLPSGEFEFFREGMVLDVGSERATFTGAWRGQSVAMEMRQPERFGKIHALVAQRTRLPLSDAQTLSAEMGHFFNTVVLDLNGTSVRFEDMYHSYNKDGEPSLRVTVGIVVTRLPNPENMKF